MLIRAPGRGHPFMQTRTRTWRQPFIRASSGSNSGSAADPGDRDREQLVHVHDLQLGAFNRVLGREVGDQQVLAERRCGTGGGDPRDTALGVDDALTVEREDRLVAAGREPLDARLPTRVVVDRERAQRRGRARLRGPPGRRPCR